MSDIATLFARDPRKHTKEDVTAIVEKLRAMRHVFNSGINSGGNVKALAPKKPPVLDVEVDL